MRGLGRVGAMVVLAACSGSLPLPNAADAGACDATGQALLVSRCAGCHGAAAANRQLAPADAVFDTPQQLRQHADAIEHRAVVVRTMPPDEPLTECEARAVSAYLDEVRATVSCAPVCDGRACGDDGCGGSCGDCGSGDACDGAGQCVAVSTLTPDAGCAPSCAGAECGDDGCGGSCGSCPRGNVCNTALGACAATCTPSCSGKTCGDDGCGGSCGSCAAGQSCSAGQCACAPQCMGRVCGPNGCGGSCGTCAGGASCTSAGQCTPAPTTAPTFAAGVFPIFQAKGCGSSACHGGSTPSESLNLSSATLGRSELVGVASTQCARTLVVAGDAASSYLVNKLTGQGMCSGSRMPRGSTALTAAQLDTVRAWINGGAH